MAPSARSDSRCCGLAARYPSARAPIVRADGRNWRMGSSDSRATDVCTGGEICGLNGVRATRVHVAGHVVGKGAAGRARRGRGNTVMRREMGGNGKGRDCAGAGASADALPYVCMRCVGTLLARTVLAREKKTCRPGPGMLVVPAALPHISRCGRGTGTHTLMGAERLHAIIESFKGKPLPLGQIEIEIHLGYAPDHIDTVGAFSRWWTTLDFAHSGLS
ncbi:hypothetical protein B0H13DRAFT_191832 [Mycena leptocephala]|nr:hypothetical protein B0H13DRAFT_191832 [Mycena leptocephala]